MGGKGIGHYIAALIYSFFSVQVDETCYYIHSQSPEIAEESLPPNSNKMATLSHKLNFFQRTLILELFMMALSQFIGHQPLGETVSSYPHALVSFLIMGDEKLKYYHVKGSGIFKSSFVLLSS